MNFSQFLTGWILPPSVSTFGPRIDSIYYIILWITGIIFVLTEAALVIFSVRYRRREGRPAYYSHGNTRIEIIWTAIPALLLIYMGFASQNLWSELRQPSRFPAKATVVHVLAEQWLWHFKYSGPDETFGTEDDITVDNALHIPVDQPVRLELMAQDVIHGFYLPDLRIHQDAVPGMTSPIWLQANKQGTYDVRCTQFCGTNHYQMKGDLTVESPEAFKTWLANSKAAAF